MDTKINKIVALAEERALALGKHKVRIYCHGDAINMEVPRVKAGAMPLLV